MSGRSVRIVAGVLEVVVVMGAEGLSGYPLRVGVVGGWASGVGLKLEPQPAASQPERTSGTMKRFRWLTARLYTVRV